MSETILVVDDDAGLRNRLRSFLAREGFDAVALAGGAELRAFLKERSATVVILDLMMPGEDGLSLTRYLRENFSVGILILTGKGEAVDRVVGLEMGADDYLAKPFNLRELLARVRSIVRRVKEPAPIPDPPVETSAERVVLTFDGYLLDLARRQLSDAAGLVIALTGAEYNLLVALASRPNQPLTRDQLLDTVAGRGWQPYDRSIDLHISHLRKKLEADPKNPAIIKTVRGAGYVFATDVRQR